jgi:hypothetical protein
MGCASLPIGAVTFQNTANTADATGAGLIVRAATVGQTIYLTDIVISTDTATSIGIQDTDSSVVAEPLYFPATSIWSKTWSSPLVLTADKGLKIVAADAGNVSVTITGYVR